MNILLGFLLYIRENVLNKINIYGNYGKTVV